MGTPISLFTPVHQSYVDSVLKSIMFHQISLVRFRLVFPEDQFRTVYPKAPRQQKVDSRVVCDQSKHPVVKLLPSMIYN